MEIIQLSKTRDIFPFLLPVYWIEWLRFAAKGILTEDPPYSEQ